MAPNKSGTLILIGFVIILAGLVTHIIAPDRGIFIDPSAAALSTIFPVEPTSVTFEGRPTGVSSGRFWKLLTTLTNTREIMRFNLAGTSKDGLEIETDLEIDIDYSQNFLASREQRGTLQYRPNSYDNTFVTHDIHRVIGWDGIINYLYTVRQGGRVVASDRVISNRGVLSTSLGESPDGAVNVLNGEIWLEDLGYIMTGVFPPSVDVAVVGDGNFPFDIPILANVQVAQEELDRWNREMEALSDIPLSADCGSSALSLDCRYVNMLDKGNTNPVPHSQLEFRDVWYGVVQFIRAPFGGGFYTDVEGTEWIENGRVYGIGYSSGRLVKESPTAGTIGVRSIAFERINNIWQKSKLQLFDGGLGNPQIIVWVSETFSGLKVTDPSAVVLVPEISIISATLRNRVIDEGESTVLDVVVENTANVEGRVQVSLNLPNTVSSGANQLISANDQVTFRLDVDALAIGLSGTDCLTVTGTVTATCGLGCASDSVPVSSLGICNIPIIVPPVDTDGDGIVDSEDNCPLVAGPSSNNGCPVIPPKTDPPITPPPPPPGDRDGDGITDNIDKCPDEFGFLEFSGCPEEPSEPLFISYGIIIMIIGVVFSVTILLLSSKRRK